MTLAQTSIFDFRPREPEAQWLKELRGERRWMCRTDAEAFCSSLGRIPTEGYFLRCMKVDHGAPYNAWCPWASAMIWWQNGIHEVKLVDATGRVEDWLDPYPYEHYFEKGTRVRESERRRILSARVEGDILYVTLDGAGDWKAEVVDDTRVHRFDRQPFQPDVLSEHLALECYRRGVPEKLAGWRERYVCYLSGYRPFVRAVSDEEAKRIDLMGRIPGGLVPSEEFREVCECAEAVGVRLNLDHRVPVLENIAMFPNEKSCSSCLRKGSSNTEECWRKPEPFCRRWTWDRRTPAKPYSKSKRKAAACLCEDEDGEGCE